MAAGRPGRAFGSGDELERVYRAAWALCGSSARAQELVQAAYADAARRGRRGEGGSGLIALLRALRRAAAQGAGEAPPPSDERPGRTAVYAAIAGLEGTLRDALVAVDVAGLSFAQAARLLRTTPREVAARLFRAREQLVRALDEGG